MRAAVDARASEERGPCLIGGRCGGAPGFGKPIWPRRASKGVHRGEFFVIGSDTAKERVYGKLRVNLPGAGYCHFPLNRERDWFDMVTAEALKRGRFTAGRSGISRNRTACGMRR
jgi:phage terminase large subunit GpA-like protein